MFKKILIILSTLFVIMLLIYWKPLFQEGNPIPVFYSIVKLNFTDDNIVQISGKDSVYITKSKNGIDSITQIMKEKNYKFTEQMGAGYMFEKQNNSVVITHRHYWRFYDIWYFPKK